MFSTNAHNSFAFAKRLLSTEYAFRRNLLTDCTEFKQLKTNDSDWEIVTDVIINSWYCDLKSDNVRVSLNDLYAIVNSDLAEVFDPIKEYFESLEIWDGTTDHIKNLSDCIGVTDLHDEKEQERFNKYFRKCLIGVVACSTEQGINHLCLTLHGEQGIFKTTFLNYLCPNALKKYLTTDSIGSDKDSLMALSSPFLILDDEFESMNKTSLGTFKKLLTQEILRYRPPYGKSIISKKRRASFMASVNNHEFIKDETGSRRFLAFTVARINPNFNNVPIDKVYAQALSLFKDGEKYWLTQEENIDVSRNNSKYHLTKQARDLFLRYFKCPAYLESDNVKHMTTTEISVYISKKCRDIFNLQVDDRLTRQMGSVLRELGLKRISKRKNGNPIYVYEVLPLENINEIIQKCYPDQKIVIEKPADHEEFNAFDDKIMKDTGNDIIEASDTDTMDDII